MPIGQNQKNVLREASTEALEINLNRISTNFQYSRWLRKGNKYENDTAKKIEDDVERSSIKNKEVNEYIAASILTHSLDSWSYFSKSIDSLLNGDIRISRHLLYYSELRSGMSILAAQGIGAFDKKHIVIKSKDRCLPVHGPRTHDFVWEALDFWIKELGASSSILDKIKLENKSLNDWLNSFSVNTGTKEVVINDFLASIGFDLRLFKEDRDARNMVSYRPISFAETKILDYKNILNQLKICWNFCEPSYDSVSNKLDKALLKRLIHISFKATDPQQKEPKQKLAEFEHKINVMFNNLGLSEGRINWWKSYLTSESESDYIFYSIDNYKDSKSDNYVYGMLYRSLFLLRISSLFCEHYVKNSVGYDKSSLSFWCNNIGINIGLWEDISQITYLSDLWEDINLEIENLNDWISSNGEDISLYKLHNEKHLSMSKLSTFERVGFWSIGI